MINILDIMLSQLHTVIQVSDHAKEEVTIMTFDEAVRILWDAIQQGDHFPAALQGKLSLDDAYRVQLGILARQVEAGEQQSGWKVAISGAALRQARGLDEPATLFESTSKVQARPDFPC
jgi:2-keto-4-pentenoate hydratase